MLQQSAAQILESVCAPVVNEKRKSTTQQQNKGGKPSVSKPPPQSKKVSKPEMKSPFFGAAPMPPIQDLLNRGLSSVSGNAQGGYFTAGTGPTSLSSGNGEKTGKKRQRVGSDDHDSKTKKTINKI
jgi:hypothetical protein